MYILIIVFNIYNAIYISTKLHISDDPEYGGRTRDQDYIDKHPEEFGDVPDKQFIVSGVCPSVIAVLNFVCFILCIIFRKKTILLYNKIISENDKKINEDNLNKIKYRHHKSSSKHRSPRKSSSKTLNFHETKFIKNYNDLEPIDEINGIKLEPIEGINGTRNMGARRFTILKLNEPNEIIKSPKRFSSRNLLSHRKSTRETMEEEAKNSKPHELKINDIDSKEDIINNKNEKDK